MNILVISPAHPYPTDSGAKIRIFELLKALSKSNRITLISLVPEASAIENLEEKLPFLHRIIPALHIATKRQTIVKWIFSSLPYRYCKMRNSKFKNLIQEQVLSGCYDIIYLNFLDSTQNLPSQKANSLYVLDQHNNDITWYKSFSLSNNFAKRLFSKINSERQLKRNNLDYQQIDLCVGVSEEDISATTSQLGSPMEFLHIANGVNISTFSRTNIQHSNTIIFCGSLDVEMNTSAVIHFVQHIFPTIVQKLDNVRLLIVGRSPSKEIIGLQKHPNISVHADVESVIPYYEQAKVAILPFLHGGGSKLKVLEAIAMEVEIVSTEAGMVGIPDEIRNRLSICKSDDDFAKCIIHKLRCDFSEPAQKKRLKDLRNLVTIEYSWNKQGDKLAQAILEMHTARVGPDNTNR